MSLLFKEPLKIVSKVKAPRVTRKVPKEVKKTTLALHPIKLVDGAIDCNVKCKGGSKLFSKAKVIFFPGLIEKEIEVAKDTMARVCNIELTDWGPSYEDGSHSKSALSSQKRQARDVKKCAGKAFPWYLLYIYIYFFLSTFIFIFVYL